MYVWRKYSQMFWARYWYSRVASRCSGNPDWQPLLKKSWVRGDVANGLQRGDMGSVRPMVWGLWDLKVDFLAHLYLRLYASGLVAVFANLSVGL